MKRIVFLWLVIAIIMSLFACKADDSSNKDKRIASVKAGSGGTKKVASLDKLMAPGIMKSSAGNDGVYEIVPVFDSEGKVVMIERWNDAGVVDERHVFTYDSYGRKIKKEIYWDNPLVLHTTILFTYGTNGKLSSVNDTSGPGTICNYEYDAYDKLVKTTVTDGAGNPIDPMYEFTYNPDGSFDEVKVTVSSSSSIFKFTYPDANTMVKTPLSSPSDFLTFHFDDEGILQNITNGTGTLVVAYTYKEEEGIDITEGEWTQWEYTCSMTAQPMSHYLFERRYMGRDY